MNEEDRWNTIDLRKFAVLSAIDTLNKLNSPTPTELINTAAAIENYILNGANTNQ